MSTKISLDVNALERLILSDDDTRLKLTQGVVEEFANRHIKKLINHELIKGINISGEIKQQISSLEHKIKSELSTPVGSWVDNRVVLNDSIKSAVANKVYTEISKLIDNAILQRTKHYKKTIEETVTAKVNIKVNDYIDAEIELRIAEKIRQIKENL